MVKEILFLILFVLLIKKRHNVWEVNTASKTYGHPAVFPEQIAVDHILSWSNKGDVVLDPFMGSGTTGVACINTGRDFVGYELDENYFNIAQERLRKAWEDRNEQPKQLD